MDLSMNHWGPIQRRSRELPDDPRRQTPPRLAQNIRAVPPQKKLQELVIGPSIKPPEDPWGTIGQRPQEPFDDVEEDIFPHLTQNFSPPPSALPQRERRTVSRYLQSTLRAISRPSSRPRARSSGTGKILQPPRELVPSPDPPLFNSIGIDDESPQSRHQRSVDNDEPQSIYPSSVDDGESIYQPRVDDDESMYQFSIVTR